MPFSVFGVFGCVTIVVDVVFLASEDVIGFYHASMVFQGLGLGVCKIGAGMGV